MPNDLLAAVASGSGKLPDLLPALVPLLVLVVALDVYCLIDVARAKSVRNVPKWVWVIIILFISAPIGALVYLFVGRDRGQDSGARAGTGAEAGQETDRALDRYSGRAPVDCRPIVTTSGLTRDYGGAGLFGVDLVVPRGSIYGLVGPNGAGKTTLLSLLSATRRPDRGTIGMNIARHRIAVCPDVPEFDGWLTAAEVTDLARSLVAPALAGEPWATRAEPVGADTIRVDATSIEAGERGIPAVLAGCGARQVSCEPVAADLESAFLALTGASS